MIRLIGQAALTVVATLIVIGMVSMYAATEVGRIVAGGRRW